MPTDVTNDARFRDADTRDQLGSSAEPRAQVENCAMPRREDCGCVLDQRCPSAACTQPGARSVCSPPERQKKVGEPGESMSVSLLGSRSTRLFVLLTAFFVGNAVVAEFVGVKIFALEKTLGLPPFGWDLFGQTGSLSFTAGVLIWPIVFILTDVINEYFGRRGVRLISYAAIAMISYGFLFAYASIHLSPADWWVTVNTERGVPDMQAAYDNVFGQGLWTIGGSITAFFVGQLIDVNIFHRIRKATGERWIWLRATGSTAFSQLVDSFVVLYIAFVLGPQQWPIVAVPGGWHGQLHLQDDHGGAHEPVDLRRRATGSRDTSGARRRSD